MPFQPPLPSEYAAQSRDDIIARIQRHKNSFGPSLVVLGHHYQEDDVIRFADFTGDSLKLSQIAARQKHARYVVFCGVHFMAESADILTGDDVAVILPDLSAGCSMADMAHIDQLEDAWDFLTAATDATIVPITYVNSSADVKAFCGRHGGACCTSSNARLILEWALDRGQKAIFLPDQHLGRNTACAMGHALDSMVLYDPKQRDGGLSAQSVRDSTFILWKGHCSVHGLFTTANCDEIRGLDPAFNILVHPECSREVVQRSDYAGSTEYIIKTVGDAPPGTKWAIGTEIHLVTRLAAAHPDKTVRSLAGIQCLCTTMYRIDIKHLLYVLDQLAAGRVVNRITVPPDVKRDAVLALDRMLANAAPQPASVD
ncbi:MAG: quinolinate synthase NadA [Phycisphaerales bacterium]|nr:quinolinate synthase NadA [Phycisphaerales bacterium]